MSDIFYVVGIGLTLLALTLSFAGMKIEKFPPSRAVMTAVLGVMGTLVIATCAFAIVLSREEAEHREDEQAEEAEAAAVEGEAEEGETPAGEQPTAPANGGDVFAANGCGGCHTLAAAGSDASVGPDLDDSLKDKDEEYIEQSIVDPAAIVAKGFGDGIMPSEYGTSLTPEDLDALVAYLAESTASGR